MKFINLTFHYILKRITHCPKWDFLNRQITHAEAKQKYKSMQGPNTKIGVLAGTKETSPHRD